MAYGKRNVIQVDPLRYSLCLLSPSKLGKTTLMYQYCTKLAGPTGSLFIETGSERGADAIAGINYINAPEWHMDEYDSFNNAMGFAEICDDIIENKSTEYPDLRCVVIDSIDHWIEIAEKESLRLYNKEARKKGKETASSLNEAWGGWGRAEKKALELMLDYRDKLLNVGVQVMYIGHIKRREITDAITQQTYSVISSDQQQNYFNALKKDLHFLAVMYMDREIIEKSTGKKTPTGKDIKEGKVESETRKIKFRDDSYVIDSGSRFSNIVPEIECDVDQFIKAITDAIDAEAKKGGQDIEASKAEQAAALAKRTKEIAEAEAKHKQQKELDTIISSLKDWIQSNKPNPDKVKALIAKSKDLGIANPLDVASLEDAKTLLAYTESL